MCPVSPNFGENAADPFAVGRVVKLRMLVVSNSAATRTSAVRTITIAEPIE